MKKLTVVLAVLACVLVPQALQAQDADEGPPETSIVTTSTFKVPMNEDRGKVLEWIERVLAPQARNNPNILAFYVLTHYYGSDSRDMMLVRVYENLAAIEAPCGEPCREYADANFPDECEEGYDEMMDLWETFMKYNGRHSDQIYRSHMDLAKN